MWQHLSRGLVRQQVQVQVQVQQVRHKKFGKFVVPHRKPRWIPMARSKMFVQPPKSLVPEVRSIPRYYSCLSRPGFCLNDVATL